MSKRAALYVRVSQDSQTVENQTLIFNEVARRSGWEIVHVFADEGISGAKGRDKRPGYDALLKAVSRREIDIVAAWSVDRLGRSLPDLISFRRARSCLDLRGRTRRDGVPANVLERRIHLQYGQARSREAVS